MDYAVASAQSAGATFFCRQRLSRTFALDSDL